METLPTMAKLGERLGLEWLLARLPSFVTGRPKLWVSKQDGLIWVQMDEVKIATTSRERVSLYKHGWKKRKLRLLRNYQIEGQVDIRSGDFVVNVGANVGELSLALSELGARVLAIEPDALTLRCLRANTSANPLVTVIPVGLWHEEGNLTFYSKPESADTSAINQVGAPFVVPVARLDTLAGETPGRIRLIVGDAEGAEPEVLAGATETLRRTDYVALDAGYERGGRSTFAACTAILEPLGFQVINIDKYGRLLARNITTESGR